MPVSPMMPRVLVVGDIMLDEFVYGDVHRISPEAATPVLSVNRITRMLGGAGNVARGIEALDCDVDLVSVIGDDDTANEMIRSLLETPNTRIEPYLVTEADRLTTRKTRYVSEQHSSHLLRVDRESTVPVSASTEQSLSNSAAVSMLECDVLVLSDYCKGVITPKLARTLIEITNHMGKVSIVDSKRDDLSIFRGATILKLNLCELGFCFNEPDSEAVHQAAYDLTRKIGIDNILVTRGEAGLSLFGALRSAPTHIPGKVVRVRDVSGAGDTVVATLAATLARSARKSMVHTSGDLDEALHAANDAAAIAVGKPGTAVVTTAELGGGKVAPVGDWTLLDQRIREWRGQRIGFTNGCFDLLHPGHLHLLTTARGNCDRLIVGLNSDASVKRLKGEGRPAQTMQARADVISHLDFVDLVVIFDADDPTELCERIRPNVMFKGSDYDVKDIAGRQWAATTHIIERVPNEPSTTDIIARINRAEAS